MSLFRNRGLRVVVDTTEPAEWDFASLQVSDQSKESIARNLMSVPRSPRDRFEGNVRIREVSGWDIAFTLSLNSSELVCTIIAIGNPDEIETTTNYLLRSGKAILPEPVQTLLGGRKRNDD